MPKFTQNKKNPHCTALTFFITINGAQQSGRGDPLSKTQLEHHLQEVWPLDTGVTSRGFSEYIVGDTASLYVRVYERTHGLSSTSGELITQGPEQPC